MKIKLRKRRCQYCCNTIGRLAALLGVVNCGDCSRYMHMGRAPRHECKEKCCGDHGELIT